MSVALGFKLVIVTVPTPEGGATPIPVPAIIWSIAPPPPLVPPVIN